MQSQRVAVGLDPAHDAVGMQPCQRRRPAAVQDQAGVAGQAGGLGHHHRAFSVETVHEAGCDLELGHARPARRHGELGPVLLGLQPDRRRLHAERQILRHQHHVRAFGPVVQRDGQDAGVVVAEPEAGREHRGIAVVELDPERAAVGVHRDGGVQSAVLDAQVVEQAQRRPGEVAEFGVCPLALQLGDHHHGEHDLVLGEPERSVRVAQQHRGVDDVDLGGGALVEVGAGLGQGVGHGRPLGRGRTHRPARLCQVWGRGRGGPDRRRRSASGRIPTPVRMDPLHP